MGTQQAKIMSEADETKLWIGGEVIIGVKPTFTEMMNIFKDILEEKAVRFKDLIDLGHKEEHVAFLKIRGMLPTCGGPVTGVSIMHDAPRMYYNRLTPENWDKF